MTRLLTFSAALLASTAMAQAGGIDRAQPNTAILFEEGSYAELSYSFVNPSVSGNLQPPAPPIASGDVTPSFSFVSLRYRQDLTENVSIALIYDEPLGADVDYPLGTGYPFSGSTAAITSDQITAIARYEFPNAFSVYSGVQVARATGDAFVTTPAFSYLLDSESETGVGFLLGVAYEIPDIAFRVAATYYSGYRLTLQGTEALGPPGTPEAVLATIPNPTSFMVELPQSVLLEARTGVAPGTLVFGSLRWTDYANFTIEPNLFPANPLVDFDEDVYTWSIGVGRQITDALSVAATIGYEAEQNTIAGNLGPTDGFLSFGLGGEYEIGNVTLGGGVQYAIIGDAETIVGPGVMSSFTDNEFVGFGLRVGYQF